MFHEHTKDLDIDCHLVWEKAKEGLLRLLPISSQNRLTDVTKALLPRSFGEIISKLRLVDIFQPPVCGGISENQPKPKSQPNAYKSSSKDEEAN